MSKIKEIQTQLEQDSAVDAFEMIWKAIRSLNIGECFSDVQQIALFDRARDYCGEALSILKMNDVVDPPNLLSWVESVAEIIRKKKIESCCKIFNPENSSLINEIFIHDQNSFIPATTLVELNPALRTCLPKPILYDIAGDFLEYPDLTARTKERKGFSLFSAFRKKK